jgi:hypothetical protein
MTSVIRSRRGGFFRRWTLALIWLSCALFGGCASGPERSDGDVQAESEALSFYLASPRVSAGPSDRVADTFRTLSGAEVELWRDPEATLVISFDAIRALRIREGKPSPSLGAPISYVTAEVEVQGALADSFLSLLAQRSGDFFWVRARDAGPIDYLPIGHAVRPAQEGSPGRVWVSAGAFRDRSAAARFFAEAGGVPRHFIALSELERRQVAEENARVLDFAIWLSVCDAPALAETGAGLSESLSDLPDYAARASGVDCGDPPQLGRRSAEPPAGFE